MSTQLHKIIRRIAEKNAAHIDYKVKKIKFVEKQTCLIEGCKSISGIIKISLISDLDPDKDIVLSLQHPCIIHGLQKLVVEKWCAINWLYADVKRKKKICYRREFFQFGSDGDSPIDNIVHSTMFWCSGCGTNKIIFEDDTEAQERQLDTFVEKDCPSPIPNHHFNQLNVAVQIYEKVADILFDSDDSFAIDAQLLYIGYRHFGISDLYDNIILILCDRNSETSGSFFQTLPIEMVVEVCKNAWKSRWETFNKIIEKEHKKYITYHIIQEGDVN